MVLLLYIDIYYLVIESKAPYLSVSSTNCFAGTAAVAGFTGGSITRDGEAIW